MAYRFSDTDKWKDNWFTSLTSKEKLMFLYLCDNCDSAGFVELSLKRLSFELSIDPEEVKVALKGLKKAYILSIDKHTLFLRNFIKHQKNLPLKRDNNSHLAIYKSLDKYKDKFDIDLLIEIHKDVKFRGTQGAIDGLTDGYGKGNGINKEDSFLEVSNSFEDFWSLYGKKKGDRVKCQVKWMKLKPTVQKKIMAILPEWKKQFSDITYQPYPETFFNQKRWEDDITVTQKETLGIRIAM